VDYVLFSDSAVKAATNEKQWYVTISRGRKGVKIFTADKIQLRQNIAHSGNRTLAMDMKPGAVQKLASALGRGVAYALNVQHSQRKSAERQAEMLRQAEALQQQEQERQAEALRREKAVKQSQAVKPVEKSGPSKSRTPKSLPDQAANFASPLLPNVTFAAMLCECSACK
jgi:hypothetical protein